MSANLSVSARWSTGKRVWLLAGLLLWLCVSAAGQRVARLEIAVENSVIYRYDVADPSQVAARTGPVSTSLNRAFTDFCQIDDIVAVNGKPAKGLHMTCGTRMDFSPSALPGAAIADVSKGAGRQECNWEILTAQGQFVGRLVDGGFFPHAIQGGAGAYMGATGEHQSLPETPARVASVAEDPSMRRVLGGGRYRVVMYAIPRFWPEIILENGAPAIYHGDTGDPVTAADPALPGELLIMKVKGLGPTLPGVTPAGIQPFRDSPFNVVNSPVEVYIDGLEAEVVNKIGWPGSLDTYRVDFRVPSGITTQNAKVRVDAAWIPSDEATLSVAASGR